MTKRKLRVEAINVGCGLNVCRLPGWENIDNSPTARLSKHPLVLPLVRLSGLLPRHLLEVPWPQCVRVYDATKSLPYPDSSLRCVYSSHFLEHHNPNRAEQFLRECYRVLGPGGILRIVVPDLKLLVEEYLTGSNGKGENTALAADRFLLRTLFVEKPSEDPMWIRALRNVFGRDTHFWLYDEHSLKARLERAGFKNVGRRAFGESLIPEIASLDIAARASESLYVEGQRP